MSERGHSLVLSSFGRPRTTGPNFLSSGYVDPLDAEELQSVAGSGITEDATDSSAGDSADSTGMSLDMFRERSQGFDDIANKNLHSSETALMIRKFEKQQDIPFSCTYRLGNAIRESLPNTIEPMVGFVFLPGADMPEVNRLEQHGMLDDKPNQRDALWRVNTAATLLSEISVTKDLGIQKHDRTTDVVDTAVTRYRKDRLEGRDRRRKDERGVFREDAVTFASSNVSLYNALGGLRLDLCATLIEVNVGSLFELMHDYRWIVQHSGHRMSFQQTKDVLDRMIEAARRFCLNSPILFRMSTRNRIIDATNIRYGVDSERAFDTFTTSAGIQEIIMMSSSYFKSLDPSTPGMDESTQKLIRPRFLQMLTLLLSLLNDRDVKSMATFLESTYGIKPARGDLELLFCKVIPLTSINSTVFLKALIPAVEGGNSNDVIIRDECPLYDHKRCWEIFLTNLARKGYLLPGTLDDLGHPSLSWVLKWPDDGINSSTVFGRLQYHGEKMSTFNEIPPGRFSYAPEVTELTVILTNDETYTIHPTDYQHISTLTKGLYTAMRCDDGSACELEVTEQVLNRAINDGMRVLNDAIRRFNAKAGPSPGSGKGSVLRRKRRDPVVFPEVPLAPRLARNEAWLHGGDGDVLLAVSYKLDGRNVPKADALRHMTYHYNILMNLFNHVCESAGRSVGLYEQYIGHINRYLGLDRELYRKEKAQQSLSASPIARAFNPEDPDTLASKLWYNYSVAMRPHPRMGKELLHIWAKHDIVRSVTWRQPGKQAEVRLAQTPTVFGVAPLKPVSEEHQGDEINVGDLVLLVGQYMVVAAPHAEDFSYPCVMLNWLGIEDALETEVGRRGRNMRGPDELPVTAFI